MMKKKMTGETPEVCSDKRKPREKEREREKREKRENERKGEKKEKRCPGSIIILNFFSSKVFVNI